MPKRRDQIRMSEDEIWQLIDDQKSLQVATLNKDGSPHLTTLWFAIVDWALVFETYTKSQKIRNLERDPRIAVLVEAGETYDRLRGVSINAKAELVTERDEVPSCVAAKCNAVSRAHSVAPAWAGFWTATKGCVSRSRPAARAKEKRRPRESPGMF